MPAKPEIVGRLLDPGLIAVVRAQRRDQVPPLTEALIRGGVRAVEITLTTPDPIGALRDALGAFGSQAVIGVGTVLDDASCRAALEAGAQFVVSPVLRPELVPLARAADRPIMLGAYSPTEAQSAHESGADFVKIFPADGLGPAYIRALRAPLPHLRLVPTGGVDVHTAADFLRAGSAALGVGSALVSSDLLRAGDWAELTRRAAALVAVVRKAREALL